MVLPSVKYVSLGVVLVTQAETVLRVTLDITNQELTVSFVRQTLKDATMLILINLSRMYEWVLFVSLNNLM